MKKFLLVFVVLFALLVFAGCEKLDSLEWEVLPKSVYYLDEMTPEQFTESVSIKINNKTFSLTDALEQFPDDVTFVGFDLTKTGLGTIIVKYKSLSIFWTYQVIEKEKELPPVGKITPDYGWYEDGKTTYTLNTVEELYGFANIVNGKAENIPADSFAEKTVKLGDDIDLTGKVWVPIGEGVRLHPNVVVENYQWQGRDFNPDTDYEEDGRKYYFVKDKLDTDKTGYKYAVEENGKWVVYYCRSGEDEDYDNVFAGTFDGQGHTIKGLSDIGYTPTNTVIYANSEKVLRGYSFGLFGIVAGNVTIKNLNFENVQIVGTYYDAEKKKPSLATMDSVGAAIGYVAKGEGNLLVENVKVLSGFISGEDAIAGIVGRAYNEGNMTFKNLENRAQITSNGHAGGMVGYIDFTRDEDNKKNVLEFINNANYGNIISSSKKGTDKAAGAIINFVGRAKSDYVTFDGCRNFGNIVGMKSDISSLGLWSGAAAGDNTEEALYYINNCYNYGVLTYKA